MFRQFRRAVRSAPIVASFMLIAVGSLTSAVGQDAAAESVSKEPVVVVSLASLDGLLLDVNHITSVAGMPQAGAMLNIYVGAFSQGIDRSQPIGIVVRMIDGAPAPMVFIAISDVKAMLKRLEPQIGPSDELEDGTLVMQVGQNLAYIRSQGDWAFLSNDRDALRELPEDPTTLLQGMHLDHDIGILANIQQIPAPLRMGLAGQMRQAFDDAVQRLRENGQGDGQVQAPNQAMIEQLETLIRDSEYFSIGLSVDAENSELAIDFASSAVEGSELAVMYNGRKAVETQFAGFLRTDATLYAHGASTIGEEEQAISLTSVDGSLKQARALLAQDEKISESDLEKIDAYIPRVKELLESTIKMGKVDGGAVVLSDNNQLRVLMGMMVPDGKKFESLFRDILEEFASNPDAPKFKFDDGSLAGLTLHRGHVDVPAEKQRLIEAFGSKIPLLLAIGDDRVFIGAGTGVDDLLKETIESSAEYSSEQELPLSQGTVSLLPALEYAYWFDENSVVDLLVKTLRSNPGNDKVQFAQPREPNGQRFTLSIDDGVLQVIGTGAQAGRPRPEF